MEVTIDVTGLGKKALEAHLEQVLKDYIRDIEWFDEFYDDVNKAVKKWKKENQELIIELANKEIQKNIKRIVFEAIEHKYGS